MLSDKNIFDTGGPGSGKSTQCEMLKMHTEYIHVSSGEALREEIASGSSRGLSIYNHMYNGEPVPNSVMTGVLRETMLSKILQKGFDVKVRNTKFKFIKNQTLIYKLQCD